MGFPGASIDEIAREEVENGEDNDDEVESDSEEASEEAEEETTNGEAPLDPRAGRVSVEMPIIEFDPLAIASIMEGIKYKKFTRVKNRKTIDRVVET